MGAPPTVFDQMSLVAIEISVWGGERQSQLKDLGEERHISGDLPPEKVAKSFSKKVIDTKHLRPFRRFRNQAHEACMAVGTQLKDRSGIYAIPDAELDSLILRLEEIEQEYKEELQRFLGDYASYVDEWIAANAEWGEWIRKSTLSLSEVEKRFSFGFFVTGFAPNKRDDGRMAEKAEELGNTLIREIAQVAEASWERTLRGRDEAGIRVLGPMKRMRRKLAACRFLNPVADQGIQQIDKLLAKMPKSGAIQGGAVPGPHGPDPALRQRGSGDSRPCSRQYRPGPGGNRRGGGHQGAGSRCRIRNRQRRGGQHRTGTPAGTEREAGLLRLPVLISLPRA
ncbi:DUF3150 domain-containing protein [Thiolapillus sp.]|uniref:DUF3150 domain-containing protein n=1 Tax=Thiolapillus sp. TaxID=2017437 RepID=UPI003AF99438